MEEARERERKRNHSVRLDKGPDKIGRVTRNIIVDTNAGD